MNSVVFPANVKAILSLAYKIGHLAILNFDTGENPEKDFLEDLSKFWVIWAGLGFIVLL